MARECRSHVLSGGDDKFLKGYSGVFITVLDLPENQLNRPTVIAKIIAQILSKKNFFLSY